MKHFFTTILWVLVILICLPLVPILAPIVLLGLLVYLVWYYTTDQSKQKPKNGGVEK